MKYWWITVLVGSISLYGGDISRNLLKQMEATGSKGYVDAMIILKEQADLQKVGKGRYHTKANILREVADRTQQPLIEYIKQFGNDVKRIRRFWVVNTIFLSAKPYVIEKIAQRQEVKYIKELSEWHILGYPSKQRYGLIMKGDKTIPWNIRKIKADSVWSVYGLSGEGVEVGILDTGIDPDHPALAGNFSGHFHDAVNHQSSPYDDHGHGTHVAGTIAGGDGPGSFSPDIGIAYNASISSCKAFTSSGSGNDTTILECSQWFVSLKADSGVDIKVINNSWGGGHGETWMWDDLWNNWRAMDIVPVFAAGNSGPGTATVGSPGDYPIVIGVGATDSTDAIANFSSRGPAPDTGRYADTTYWSRPDWNFIKPDVSAPGVSIYSSLPGGNYDSWDGTSMATPHVTGVIALMFEKNPNLDYYTIYDILTNEGVDTVPGYTFPNNDYGWGRINAMKIIEATPSPNAPFIRILTATISDSIGGNGNGEPDPGESVIYTLTLKNMGTEIHELQGILRSLPENGGLITITDSLSSYGDIPADSIRIGDGFSFTIDSSWRPGKSAKFELYLKSEVDTYEHYDTLTLQIGKPIYYTWYEFDFSSPQGWNSPTGWAITNSEYHSSPSSFTDSPDGVYPNNAFNYLEFSNGFDLDSAYFARIIFWHKYNFERNYDFGYVQITDNPSDSTSWQTLATYTDSIVSWVCETIPIPSSFMGKMVYIRFLVKTDPSVQRDGWYVDDVVLQQDYPLNRPVLVLAEAVIMDSITGNGNGMLDPGESDSMRLTIKNIGNLPANNIQAEIVSTDPRINISPSTLTLAELEPDSSHTFHIGVSADSSIPLGTEIDVNIYLSSSETNDTFSLTLQVGEHYISSDDSSYYKALDDGDRVYTSLAPEYEYIDISSIGTKINFEGIDDERAALLLPFTFKFYGNEFDTLWVCTNGWMSFGADPGTNDYSNDSIPDTTSPNNVLALLWDDLKLGTGGDTGIYYYYDTTNHRFIIHYHNIYFLSSSSTIDAVAVLYDPAYYPTPTGDGKILFLYNRSPAQEDITVGIENGTGTLGIEYFYNGALGIGARSIDSGRAILFLTNDITSVNERKDLTIKFGARILYKKGMTPMLKFSSPYNATITLSIYDITGRKLQSAVFNVQKGTSLIPVPSQRLRNGIYFIRLQTHGYRKVIKFINLKR